jgi:DNA polymerase-3 subunit epsilon
VVSEPDRSARTQVRFEQKVEEIWAYLQGAELIIHNAPFDLGFLNKELELASRPPIRQCVSGVIDTLAMAKEIFPGKRNSLDALCDRLEVDNSGRTLHGALLDAELLADVYINLTRGQEALIMAEEPAESEGGLVVAQLDLSSFRLHVVQANEQELAAHEDVLVQMDKSSGGKTIWRGFENQSQNL